MTIKTYAIHGLSEWHGDVKAGTVSVRVSFTGGTASPSGALPAYFVTKDPVTQFVLENSKEFKNGFIRLEMQQTIAGEHPRMAVQKPAPATPVVTPVSTPPEVVPPVVEEPAEDASASTTAEAGGEHLPQEVEFDNNEDAKDYFAEHYGVSRTRLRTRSAIEEVANSLNVKVTWKE